MSSPIPHPTHSINTPDSGREQNNEETNIKVCLLNAEELKLEGNDHFRGERWDKALSTYRSGLGQLPKRREPVHGRTDGDVHEYGLPSKDIGVGHSDSTDLDWGGNGEKEIEESKKTQSELDKECAKARAVMNANIGACYVKLGEHKDAVQACTEALLDDPQYIKALQRRASSNEIINSFSSLASAQEDYTALLALLPPSQLSEVRRKLQYLKPRVEEAQKRETGEMLDKLKGLGNSILGHFGLSTDNFKFEPNEQGGYSMNFTQ